MIPRKSGIGLSFVLALGLGELSAFAETTRASDSASVDTATAFSKAAEASADSDLVPTQVTTDSGKGMYEYIAYPTLQLLTWPFENVLAPAVGGLLYPLKPPLRYLLNENVIDRTIDMLSFGPEDKVMLYPTLAVAPGTGSRTGLTLRHRAIFGRPTERLVAQGVMYVNGDFRLRGYLNADELLGSGFKAKFSASINRVKNTSANQPGRNEFWYYADTSEVYSASLSHSLIEKISGKLQYNLRVNRFGKAPPQEDDLISPFFFPGGDTSLAPDLRMRGLESEWLDNIFSFSIGRDTRNNSNITLDGSNLSAGWSYHLTNAGHDFHEYKAVYSKFFKLGKERYELTRDEERERLAGMNLKTLLAQLEYRKLRENIFNRKVLAVQFYAAQSLEVPRNRMPVYGLQTLGNDTPMRGYAGSRFRNYTVAAFSSEYRFPLMRLVDGDIFNEYGVIGEDWSKIDYLDFKNSWGFGIRVRRPDIFLFRCEAGFHGLHGVVVNLTVDGVY